MCIPSTSASVAMMTFRTGAVEPLLDIEGGLQEVELLVLVDDLLRQAVGVEGLALQREDGLGLDVAARREGARGRVALHDEDRAVLRSGGPCRPGAGGSRADFRLWSEAFLARSRARLRIPVSSLRSCSLSWIRRKRASAVSGFLWR